MQYVSNMCQGAQDYWQKVPQNTTRQMVYSFATAFIIRSITSNNPRAGLIAGVISAVATAIHGLVTPLFKNFIGQQRPLTWGEEMARTFTAIIATGYIAAAFGETSILANLTALGIFYGLITYMDPSRRDINSTDWLIVAPTYPTPVAV